MRDDDRDKPQRAGSPDRKTRVKGDRVIHTTKGTPYQGDRYHRPAGLTTEQGEDQRTGTKIDERHVREAARGERQATHWGDSGERQGAPGERPGRSDELSEQPYGKKGKLQEK